MGAFLNNDMLNKMLAQAPDRRPAQGGPFQLPSNLIYEQQRFQPTQQQFNPLPIPSQQQDARWQKRIKALEQPNVSASGMNYENPQKRCTCS